MHWKDGLKSWSTWRGFFPALVIIVNSLTWNTLVLSVFSGAVNGLSISSFEILALFGVEYIAVAVSVIIASAFFPRSRRISLFIWMIIGAVVSILLTTIPNNSMPMNMLISALFGISVGAGLPSSLTCFADATTVENRGLFGGITFFFVGIFTLFFVSMTLFLNNVEVFWATVLWRMIGAFLFLLTYKQKQVEQEPKVPSYSSILSKRELIFYLVPWVMFCLLNWIESPLLTNLFGEAYNLIGFIEVIVAGVFALVGGLIADFAGRKRVIIIGFIILGLDYAVLSLMSGLRVSWYIYAALDSIAWGMFAAVFFMTLWGDLAGGNQKEKYYVVGGLPYLLGMFLSELVKPYVEVMPLIMAFSLASFFLFVAVLPLMYASETLPEKEIKDRELKEYLNKARKAKEKYA